MCLCVRKYGQVAKNISLLIKLWLSEIVVVAIFVSQKLYSHCPSYNMGPDMFDISNGEATHPALSSKNVPILRSGDGASGSLSSLCKT